MVRDADGGGGSGQWPEFSVDLEVLAQFRAKMARVADEWGRVVSEASSGLGSLSSGDFGAVFSAAADTYNANAPMLLTTVRKYGELLDGAATDLGDTLGEYRDSDAASRRKNDSYDTAIEERMASNPLWWDA